MKRTSAEATSTQAVLPVSRLAGSAATAGLSAPQRPSTAQPSSPSLASKLPHSTPGSLAWPRRRHTVRSARRTQSNNARRERRRLGRRGRGLIFRRRDAKSWARREPHGGAEREKPPGPPAKLRNKANLLLNINHLIFAKANPASPEGCRRPPLCR